VVLWHDVKRTFTLTSFLLKISISVPVTKKNIRRYVTNGVNKFALLNIRREMAVCDGIKLKYRNRKEGSFWKINDLIYLGQNMNNIFFIHFVSLLIMFQSLI